MSDKRTWAPILVVAALFALGACNAAQRAAREDPMKCERDPKCDKKRGRTADCSMQCSDDPACMERCEQIQAPNKLGH
ncbi:MAG: hypothetical protein K0S65_470 [Labilithrix sp.]|jgi:hypothetical protein|nr:hypothetical protein [Labilithrix sp.]